MPAPRRPARGRRKAKKNIPIGQAHIKTSFNNTIVSLTDQQGNVIAWESAGGPNVRAGGDGWAIYAQDGSMTAHYEFTVAVTADGPRVLTPWHRPDGERDGVGNITGWARAR